MQMSRSSYSTQSDCYDRPGAHPLYKGSEPRLLARPVGRAAVTVTQIAAEHPEPCVSPPVEHEDAVLLSLQFRDRREHIVWENGKKAEPCDVHSGDTVIYDLRRDPRVLINCPYQTLSFHIPRGVFDALEEDTQSQPIGDISYRPGEGIADEKIRTLGAVLAAELLQPERCQALFVNYVTLALSLHVASTYGNLAPREKLAKGGLAPWQARRAQEMLGANLDGDVELEDVARECGLSVSHFSRAFRSSIGMPPHRWLIKRRIDAAKELMRQGRDGLSDIALACGFADQSHFTRIFSRETGTSPGQWRRCIAH